MLKKLFWPTLIIISAIQAGLLAWSDSGGVLRPIFVFWFILICPGMAIIRLLEIEDQLSETVLAIAFSLVLSTLLAGFLLLTHLWSPFSELAILIGISLAGAGLQIKRALQFNTSIR